MHNRKKDAVLHYRRKRWIHFWIGKRSYWI